MNKLIFLIPLSLIMLGCTTQNTSQVTLKDKTFNIEVVSSSLDRSKGLMFRTSLEEDKGMLFIFPSSSRHSFWMKNTYIPLDIIWINEALEIVHINKDTQPCKDTCNSITPDNAAKYVLEINSGLVEKYNFKLGDKVEIKE
jgi:uncharacterized protein